MYRNGHYGVALLVYAPFGFVLSAVGLVELGVGMAAIMVGGAMVPDLDQQIPGIDHRGPTHTVWFAVVAGLVVAAGVTAAFLGASGNLLVGGFLAVVGFLAGFLTIVAHLLADVLTPMGIRPFAPVAETTYTLEITNASNTLANYVLLGLGAVVAAGATLAGVALGG
jgi:inner membrane protein